MKGRPSKSFEGISDVSAFGIEITGRICTSEAIREAVEVTAEQRAGPVEAIAVGAAA